MLVAITVLVMIDYFLIWKVKSYGYVGGYYGACNEQKMMEALSPNPNPNPNPSPNPSPNPRPLRLSIWSWTRRFISTDRDTVILKILN